MKWRTEFSVGIEEIDEQHKVLADCVTLIENAVIGKERWLAVHSALVRAADFARIHFAVEESLMRIHAYPALERHIVEHRKFSDVLESLQTRSLSADVSEEMIPFLRGWLEEHVPMHDQPYASHFLLRKA
jgi:hemerythrin